MTTEFIITKLLPLSLAIIMFGFGLTLTPADFKRIAQYPKSVVLGLFCQMVLLPLLAFIVCKAFGLSSEISIGVMILAASPGGITANLFSHLAHGDIALNLTLTAINSVLAAFSLPLIVNMAFNIFAGQEQNIGLQFAKTVEVFAIVLIPVAIGMFVKNKNPSFSQKMDKPVRIFSMLVLVIIVVGAVLKEKEQMAASFAQIGIAMLVFNLGSMFIGYLVPLVLKLSNREATAISMEVGIHNSTLAIYVAVALLGSFALALPAAVYSIIMFFTAALFSLYLAKKNK
jgi:bile acid:Na+ symporter, BASS family